MTTNSNFNERPKKGVSEVLLAKDTDAYYKDKHRENVALYGRHAAAAAAEDKGLTLIVMSPWTGEHHMTNEEFTLHVEERNPKSAAVGQIAAEIVTPRLVEVAAA